MKKRILIIGQKGFMAANLSKFLKTKNIHIISTSFDEFIKNYSSFDKKFEYIINCSSNKNFVNKKYLIKNDNDLRIANKIVNSKTKLIMLSTRKVYKPKFNIKETDLKKPKCNYSKNKLIAENSIKKILKNKSLILRIVNIVGSPIKNKRKIHKTFINIFFDKAKSGIIYKNSYIYKDFLSIKNFSEIVFKLIKKNSSGIYNVSSGKKIYINQIVNWLNFYNRKKIIKIFAKKGFNNDNFTLNNRKLIDKIKIKNISSDLKNECMKISKKFFQKK